MNIRKNARLTALVERRWRCRSLKAVMVSITAPRARSLSIGALFERTGFNIEPIRYYGRGRSCRDGGAVRLRLFGQRLLLLLPGDSPLMD
jgi:hypothetical protein